MRYAWLSTLRKLPLDRTLLPGISALISQHESLEKDKPLKITPEQLSEINNWINARPYPNCKACGKALCGTNACTCQHNRIYRDEYAALLHDLSQAEHSIRALINAPFRQSRNAYGFSSSLFSGTNLLLANAFKASVLGLAGICSLLIIPPLTIGVYVYYRGKREEEKINAEIQADFLDKKISLLGKHKELVALRYTNTPNVTVNESPPALTKPPKEKRGVKGNSLSHFIVSSLATATMSYTLIKFGLLATVVVAGGPIAWAIAAGVGFLVGCYFGYKRYQHLTCKIKVEKQLAKLNAHETDFAQKIKTCPRIKPTAKTERDVKEKPKNLAPLRRTQSCPALHGFFSPAVNLPIPRQPQPEVKSVYCPS